MKVTYKWKISFLLNITVLFFINSLIGQNNSRLNGIATYKVSFDYSKQTSEINTSPNEFLSKTVEKLDLLTYKLMFNNEESIFEIKDQMNSEFENDSFLKSAAQIGGVSKIYTNIAINKLIESRPFSGDVIVFEETIDYNWKTTNERRVISGYTCYKATLKIEDSLYPNGKSIVAWFCPELSIPFGPKGYFGLPGLILELSLNNLTFSVKNIEYVSHEVDVRISKKGIKMSREEFVNYVTEKINEFNISTKQK